MGEDMSENIIKDGRGISQKKLSEIYEKQIKDEENLEKLQQDLRDKEPALMTFATLEKQWKEYELNEDEILELGVEGNVRFFVKLKNVTVCWFALYGAPPERDPRGLRDIKDLTPFQVTKLSIEDIWCSMDNPKKISDIQLVCLDELKAGYDKTREDNLPAPDGYVSIICQYEGVPDNEPDSHVLKQRTRRVMDLWALTEDVKRYESDNHLIEEHPTKTEHSNEQPTPSQLESLTDSSTTSGFDEKEEESNLPCPPDETPVMGQVDLCTAFGLKPRSFDAVRKRVRNAGVEFHRKIPGNKSSSPFLCPSEIVTIKVLWNKK